MLTLLALLLAVSLTAFFGLVALDVTLPWPGDPISRAQRIYTALALPVLAVSAVVVVVLRSDDPEDVREIIVGAFLDVWTGKAH